MKKELDEALCKEFPSIFRDYGGDMRETCMAWDISCGDGWNILLRNICLFIDNALCNVKNHIIYEYKDKNKINFMNDLSSDQLKELKLDEIIVVADQVKEKFGALCFYWHSENLPEEWHDRIDGAIRMAEMLSTSICEECGDRGVLRGPGWLFTACENHSKGVEPLEEYRKFEDELEKKNGTKEA